LSWTLILANLAPLFLGLGAVAAFSWFVDVLMGEVYRPSKSNEEETTEKEERTDAIDWRRGIVRLIGLLGIPFGVLCFISLISILLNPGHPYGDMLTMCLLAWTGIALFLTPISKLPWAALMGLAAGIIAVIAVTIVAPLIPEFIIEQIALKWILIGVFIIVGVLVFGLFKWAESLLELVCTILGSRPLLLILSFVGVIQAIALIFFGGNGGILWLFIH
jgi:hypothetical protein